VVLAFHAGVPGLRGGFVGVDVFFVISGFLITGLLVKEVSTTGRLSLRDFYARRARRLLPATAVVLGVVALLTVSVLPITRWASIARDIGASALYTVNWRLASTAVDYLGSEAAPSPVQHFWSLAVEEQFYIAWPVLITVLLLVRRRTGWALGPTLFFGILAIVVPSFLWSIHLTSVAPGSAYFVTTTRAWELAVGAILSLAVGRLAQLPRNASHALGIAGTIAILVSAMTFDGNTAFPGSAALVPTLGAAAVIAAGVGKNRHAVGALLSTPLMRGIGGLSYSLYLWHWPLIVCATAAWAPEDGTLPATTGVLVVAASAVPAWLTYRLIEKPFHLGTFFSRYPGRALAMGAACTAMGIAAAYVVGLAVPAPRLPPKGVIPAGAAALGDHPASLKVVEDRASYLVPDPTRAGYDVAGLGGSLCIAGVDAPGPPCEYGPPTAKVTVALVGDSKMHQWLSAFQRIADHRGWHLITYLANGCAFAKRDGVGTGLVKDCSDFNNQRLAAILANPNIGYVVTSQLSANEFGYDNSHDSRMAMIHDMEAIWRKLIRAGKRVIVIPDNPNPNLNVMDCVVTHLKHLAACSFPRSVGARNSGVTAELPAARATRGVRVVDLRDWICPGTTCPAVIGNVVVYRQTSHLTATFTMSLVPRLEAMLVKAMA
jgi:peptidoglycan/LPS O-acetylase OafA/YrhL